MCGIAGYILKQPIFTPHPASAALLSGIAPRGPDDEGVCVALRHQKTFFVFSTRRSHPDVANIIPLWKTSPLEHDSAFFHTRYSIIDTSAGGHQPFVSRDGTCAAVFNGEIYNYLELREALMGEGVVFLTSSDTEVLVEGFRHWGKALWPKLNGFWSVVIMDTRDGSVVFSRDRLGVAPLYVRETDEGIFFSSLIESLCAVADRPHLNTELLHDFVDLGIKDTDGRTVYDGIVSLPPAVVMTLPLGRYSLKLSEVNVFWRLPESTASIKDFSFNDAVRMFRELLFDAVRLRLRSDVRVGFELSGGLDSSSIVAVAAELTKQKLTTYTLKVNGRDEEPFARAMLKKYALDYRVIVGLEVELRREIEGFSRVMEEPYDTPANYLHHVMLKRMKAEGIAVVLTGAGGDEALAGYEASFWPTAYREWRASIGGQWPADWYEFCRRFRTVDEAHVTFENYARAFHRRMGVEDKQVFGRVSAVKALSFSGLRRYHFTTALLPYYLRSTDHYTMNIPVEHRFPLLDYRLVEFGVRLPMQYLFKNGWTKYILRKAMEPYLPKEIVWRRQKFGFPFAYHDYFSGKSQEWRLYLEKAVSMGFHDAACGYEVLAEVNPLLLWRLIAVGAWYMTQESVA